MRILIVIAFLSPLLHLAAQNSDGLNILHITSAHTSFPDTARAKGHLYKNVLYDAATHYQDSTVLIITPMHLDAMKKVDIIFWFHGWGNNVDSAAIRYGLTSQFGASHLNAVLVLAETTYDAPDSYGGKLENKDVFKELVNDVLVKLRKEKLIGRKCMPRNILLAGHSGAYRVMASILQIGGLPIKETILFDALYAETGKYLDWIKADSKHRFINIYTDNGGTDEETNNMLKSLKIEGITYNTMNEASLNSQMISENRILIIHSLRKHNDIINQPDNFELFIENSPFLKKQKR